MRLRTVRVKNFKCVQNSNEFKIDEKVTCLVGKNESGKTTLLQAISKVNPVDPDDADFDLLEYPRRHLVAYQERSEDEAAEALVTSWDVSEDDIADLERMIGPSARQITSVRISKGYDNLTHFEVEVDEQAVLKYVLGTQNLDRNDERSLQGVTSLAELHGRLTSMETPFRGPARPVGFANHKLQGQQRKARRHRSAPTTPAQNRLLFRVPENARPGVGTGP